MLALSGRRHRGRDHRGPGPGRAPPPPPGRVHRARGVAVRHLHPGHDHGGARRCSITHRAPVTPDQVREGLAGNLCRCTGYTKIFDRGRTGRGHARTRGAASYRARARGAPLLPAALARGGARDPGAARGRGAADRGGHRHPGGGEGRQGRTGPPLRPDRGARAAGHRGGWRHEIRIGAAVTHTEMLASPLVARYAPALPIGVRGGSADRRSATAAPWAATSPTARPRPTPFPPSTSPTRWSRWSRCPTGATCRSPSSSRARARPCSRPTS